MVIYSNESSNVHVTIRENSINCSGISWVIETEPITTLLPMCTGISPHLKRLLITTSVASFFRRVLIGKLLPKKSFKVVSLETQKISDIVPLDA